MAKKVKVSTDLGSKSNGLNDLGTESNDSNDLDPASNCFIDLGGNPMIVKIWA